jgi:hypothetical protein
MAIGGHDGCGGFTNKVQYYSERYDKYVTVTGPYRSDGATCAPDIDSDAWWFHDVLCDRGKWDDGTPLTNWQCSNVLCDVMAKEQYNYFRCKGWKYATFLGGGGKARKNGMFRI